MEHAQDGAHNCIPIIAPLSDSDDANNGRLEGDFVPEDIEEPTLYCLYVDSEQKDCKLTSKDCPDFDSINEMCGKHRLAVEEAIRRGLANDADEQNYQEEELGSSNKAGDDSQNEQNEQHEQENEHDKQVQQQENEHDKQVQQRHDSEANVAEEEVSALKRSRKEEAASIGITKTTVD
jgi:hypothetical protein